MASAAFSSSALTTAFKSSRSARSKSQDSLQSLEQISRKHPEYTLKHLTIKKAQDVSKVPPVSRLELLLTSRSSKPEFIPEEDTTASHETNQAIKLCSQWTDIQDLILKTPLLSSSNLAFALYRLGCLAAFDSRKRIADLKQSKLVPHLFDLAMQTIDTMEPASLVLLLDGCARLQHQPTEFHLSKISNLLACSVHSLNARQLPLVLWAFSSLHYTPRHEVLVSLEDAVSCQAPELLPQGLALVLNSFHAAKFRPSEQTLDRLTDIVQRKLLLFRPSDLANCLNALSALKYTPSPSFLQAIIQRRGDIPSHVFGGPFVSHDQKPCLAPLS